MKSLREHGCVVSACKWGVAAAMHLTGSVLFFTISSNLSFGSIHFLVAFAFRARSSKSNSFLPRDAQPLFVLGPLYSKRDIVARAGVVHRNNDRSR